MVVRVAQEDRPAFQLRPGEEGISVFDPESVHPPLAESEILEAFRAGSRLITRSVSEIEAKGLTILPIPGAAPLPDRLREAHAEIRPGGTMTRKEFKQALKELE
mgnify:CR=1 FL=1